MLSDDEYIKHELSWHIARLSGADCDLPMDMAFRVGLHNPYDSIGPTVDAQLSTPDSYVVRDVADLIMWSLD